MSTKRIQALGLAILLIAFIVGGCHSSIPCPVYASNGDLVEVNLDLDGKPIEQLPN